jgi:EAL domain-containing protein (putative c-di-GMP-specific phosphodiesterase class I)
MAPINASFTAQAHGQQGQARGRQMLQTERNRADVDRQDADPVSQTIHLNDGQVLQMVRDALRRGRLRLAFQPVVMAANFDRIGFHEGLIRVLDPAGRPIPAASFMPAVEAHELGREIDCASLAMGLQVLAAHPGIRLSINMSARSIGYAKWMRILRSVLSETPELGERLILEITERSAMLLPDIVSSFMRQWGGRGVSFALDDYGAGTLSIPALHDFAFDILKIDGSFVRGIQRNKRLQVISASLLAVSKQMETLCVAESVESPAEAAFLRALGVDMLQGFAFGAPTVEPEWLHAAMPKTA